MVGERSAVGVFLANAVKETLIKTGHVAPEDAQAMVDRSRCVQGDIRDHYAEVRLYFISESSEDKVSRSIDGNSVLRT